MDGKIGEGRLTGKCTTGLVGENKQAQTLTQAVNKTSTK